MSAEAVLSIEGLHKSYATGWRQPPRPALSGLDLEVPRGSIVGLLGPNGAGKTTTLKCVVGLIRPQAGRVALFGEANPDSEARKRIGFLPEQPYFDLYLTPRKLLLYYGRLAGLRAPTIRTRISHLLNLVGMEEEADLSMDKYSKGMLQRIGLAQALITEPEFLILDEPSSGLDPLGKMQVRSLLEGLQRGGCSILLSSHQLSEIEEICDAVAIVHQGRNVASGKLEDLLMSREEYEIVLARPLGVAADLPASASWLRGRGDRLALHERDVNAALKALLDAGAVIEEVRRRRMTLEEYFVTHVGEGKWEVEE